MFWDLQPSLWSTAVEHAVFADNTSPHFTHATKPTVNSLPPRGVVIILNWQFSNSYKKLSWAFPIKLPADKCYNMISLKIMQNIGSDNGLVPSGNEPLPEPLLTQFFVTIWRLGPHWTNILQENVHCTSMEYDLYYQNQYIGSLLAPWVNHLSPLCLSTYWLWQSHSK